MTTKSFETLSKIKLYHEQWKIVIGYDLTNLEKNYDMLSVAYTNLYQRYFLKLLNEENWTCSSKHRLAWRLIEITGDLDNMLHLAGFQRKTKIKRRLFLLCKRNK